jgi:hypothetical protein
MGLDNLGFLLGLWGATRFKQQWRGILLMACGGFLSAWSWGMAACWIIYICVAICYRFGLRKLVVLCLAGIVIHLPIIYVASTLSDVASSLSGNTAYNYFNYKLVLGALGRPFIPYLIDIGNIPYSNFVGSVGLFLGMSMVGLIFYLSYRTRRIPEWSVPAIALMLCSLMYLYQVSLVRTSVGAWYVAISINFWIGLCGLVLLANANSGMKHIRQTPLIGSVLFLGMVGILYIPANLSFENKTPFFQSRTLSTTVVSAECIFDLSVQREVRWRTGHG